MKEFNKDKALRKLRFKRNKGKYIKWGTIGLSVVILIVGVLYFSFARFESSAEFTIVNAKVGDFSGDVKIISYEYGGEKHNEPPSKNSEYAIDKVECTNATGTWNSVRWGLFLDNITGKVKCNIKFKVDELHGAEPELYKGMIPVKYVNNEIVIADKEENYYDYSNHEWANAVIPVTPSNYFDSSNNLKQEKIGTTLQESDIAQMYVWIPRYRYLLWNADNGSSNEQMISVAFEDKNTTKSTGSTNGNWLTHPAFTFGSTELNGFWVGKFEPSHTTLSSSKTANNLGCSNETCTKASGIQILPNKTSLRYNNIANFFYVSRSIENTSTFGLNASEIDTHMMKNMEWGAVAYLSASKYGRYNNDGTCISGGCEIWINPNSNYTTGCAGESVSASSGTTCNAWNTTNGYLASTTGTIYGVYDMSGGSFEYVMGNGANSSTYTYQEGSSGLSTKPNDKYIDTYTNPENTDTAHKNGKLGDATKETLKTFGNHKGGWYSDHANFPYYFYVWFMRGGHYGDGSAAGAFYFLCSTGNANSGYSFRVVLTAQDGNS